MSRAPGKKTDAEKAQDDLKKKVTLHLRTSQWRALKVYAAQNDKEMSEVVSELLTQAGIK